MNISYNLIISLIYDVLFILIIFNAIRFLKIQKESNTLCNDINIFKSENKEVFEKQQELIAKEIKIFTNYKCIYFAFFVAHLVNYIIAKNILYLVFSILFFVSFLLFYNMEKKDFFTLNINKAILDEDIKELLKITYKKKYGIFFYFFANSQIYEKKMRDYERLKKYKEMIERIKLED